MATLRIRKVLLGVVLFAGLGPLGALLAYGLYLNSTAYRRALEVRVSEYLQMPVQIGRCSPLGFESLALDDVRATLPDRGAQIFHCFRAVWRETGEPGSERHTLDLQDGKLTLGSTTQAWRSPDYHRVLESGLGHDFTDVKLDTVRLAAMDVDLVHPQWKLNVQDALGWIVPARDSDPARAVLEASGLNGQRVEQPIRLSASFGQGHSVILHQVRLDVPRIPVAALKLPADGDLRFTSGYFSGTIIYRQVGSPSFSISGTAEHLDLAEITAAYLDDRVAGRVEQIIIGAAEIDSGRLERIEFSGRLADVQLAGLTAALGLPPVGGCLALDVSRGVFADGRVEALQATGSAGEADLQRLTELLGLGRMTGLLSVELLRLSLVDGEIQTAEMDVVVSPLPHGPATIDRKMVIDCARNMFDAELPNLPFEELECAHVAAKILIEGRRLRVLSIDDEGVLPILSIRLLGREMSLLRAPERSFDLDELVTAIREKIGQCPQEPADVSTRFSRSDPRPL